MNLDAEIARMEAVIVPECDCLRTWRGAGLHRPGCARLRALFEKYRPNDTPPSKDQAGPPVMREPEHVKAVTHGTVWDGGNWVFEVVICPVCHEQLWPDDDSGAHSCYEHEKLVDGVTVKVRADPLDVLDQLGQLSEQTQVPGE